jgi:hypothetical protein
MALFRQFITGGSSAWGDLLLAVFSLMTCVAVATWAFYTTTGSRLQVITEHNPFPSALTSLPLILHRLAKLATWEQHYIDCSDELYKRRHLMLIDGLRVPWWTALEIASALFQGTTLGVRVNSLSICRTQQWIMTFQTAAIFCLAFYYHPFGAKMPNYFLVLSKFSAFVISLLGLLETLLFDDALSFASNIVATVAMAIGTFDVGFSVFLLVWAVVVPKITAIGRRKARQARNIETELISCVSPDPLRFSPPTDTVCVPPQTILGEAVPTPPLREKKQSAPLFHSKSLSSEACDEREAAQQRLLSQVLDRLTVAVDPTPAPELREARFRALVESICLHSQLIQSKKMTEQVLRGEQR